MFKAKQIMASGNAHNSLTPGTTIKGNIIAEEDLRIDGVVEGNIECKGKVVIGPSGQIFGCIDCLNLEVMGKVNGNSKARETLNLKGTAVYTGDVIAKNLEIEAGASFNGTCKMQENAGRDID